MEVTPINKVFYNISLSGFLPLGTLTIVIAQTKCEAVEMLKWRLKQLDIDAEVREDQFVELDTSEKSVTIVTTKLNGE